MQTEKTPNTVDNLLEQLYQTLINGSLTELPQTRMKIAHLDAKLASRIDKLKHAWNK